MVWFLFLFLAAVVIFFVYSIYAIINGAPFVPMRKRMVKELLRIADLKKGETLMDLGSGDGRILFAAAKKGAYATGVEINPLLCLFTLLRRFFGRYHHVSLQRTNLWNADVRDVDVITVFFIASKMGLLEKKLRQEMKPGARVVSCQFQFPTWQYTKKHGTLYVYIV